MGLHSIIVGIRSLILIPFSIVVLASIATVMLLMRMDERTINRLLGKYWARFVIWLAAVRVTVRGVENIPSVDKPYLVVFNHQSNMDIPVLVHSLPLQLRLHLRFSGQSCRNSVRILSCKNRIGKQ